MRLSALIKFGAIVLITPGQIILYRFVLVFRTKLKSIKPDLPWQVRLY